jgi:hypothetical protein
MIRVESLRPVKSNETVAKAIDTRHAFSPPHGEEKKDPLYSTTIPGSLPKPPAAAYAQRGSSTPSTIPAGFVDKGTVAPSQLGTSNEADLRYVPVGKSAIRV